jgi:hypothetical protein
MARAGKGHSCRERARIRGEHVGVNITKFQPIPGSSGLVTRDEEAGYGCG